LYGLSKKAPKFVATVMISGIYDIHTDRWTGVRKLFAPVFNLLYSDILGVNAYFSREEASPVAAAAALPAGSMKGNDWYVLNARMELMGLEPFQSMLFDASALCTQLQAKGASVKRVACGLNHWLLIYNVEGFIRPFCEALAA